MRVSFSCGLFCAAVVALTGCTTLENPRGRLISRHRGQHDTFRTQDGWRKLVYRNNDLLSKATAENSAVEIATHEQRGLLVVDGHVAMDFPVATGKASHPTPQGAYKIIEKKKDHQSNLYGRIVSGEGQTVVSDADTRADAVPQGGRFVGASMPYWMRLTQTGIGMHVGYIPGSPASHGCIRLKKDVAVELFGILKLGSPVTVDAVAPSLDGPAEAEKAAPGETAARRASG